MNKDATNIPTAPAPRSGGRAGRQGQRMAQQAARRPYLNRRIGTFNILDEEGLSLIEANADRLLKEVGMEFHDDPEILDIFREAGADVKGTRVRFELGMCRKIVRATAPSQFKQHARNPANTVMIGGDNTVLCPSWGPPFVHDLDRGRRYATIADFRDLVKIHQMIPHLHHSGGVVCEPVDLPANKRHLDMLYAHVRHSDRAFMGAFIGSMRAQDAVDIAKIVFGEEFVATNAVLYNVSNTNAPLVLDANMSGSLKVCARNNQPVACTPWTLAGAMSPCTVAGTLAQVLAEALACLSLVQLINPGAPCLMGSFASTISMQSGAPTFGTPEAAKMVLAAGQLARRVGVPFHTVGTLSASKLPDAQAEQEGTLGLLMSLLAGANVINHATGWLEGGLVTSFEKTIIDADLCGKVMSLFEGIDLSVNGQAMDAIGEVGPGSHFLGSAHTQSNFLSAFYRSTVSDNNSFEQWNAEGGLDAAQRASRQWKKLLSDYVDPGLDPAIDEALQAFIAKRKESMPDQDYF
ncbi:trimethylamine methyltransferase family protein [Mesorhizobium sp. ESP6-5]|uniref:trimethylamine methyltransferase family protein n=1 Tax=unclassified Mesorhizobium TaxID=325217 RepID=UPI00112D136F|nr:MULTISPECIES: trimethylamine methyltransferase family protein [unclassified Mesorhizobium]MBZ9756823.1 trimethylamine methyltransferase family protein [Mesorhizobium sp. ESP6-5]TPK19674.1 trimethylamine methyltransferase family protein [Mesorhizobium sp. B2-5-9]